jgi:ATP-dependent DNA helicase RecG
MTDNGSAKRLSLRSVLHSVDMLPHEDYGVEIIDVDKVAAHIAQAQSRGRYDGPTSPMDYLIARKCLVPSNDGFGADNLRATLAGILCFGHDPQAILPHAVVDIGHYRGTSTVSYEVAHLEKGIGGTVFDQLRRVEDYLWRSTNHGMTLPRERGLERVELHEYPLSVIRELLLNLLSHRDYTLIGSAARVTLFRNRIEWISPGGLPPGVTEDNLLAVQIARNPSLQRILYEAGLVEGYGQGLDTVVQVLAAEKMEPPTFRDVGAAFIATVYGRAMDQVYTPISGVEVRLTDAQHRIVYLLQERGELAASEIIEAFADSRGKRSIQGDLQSLVEQQVINRVGNTRALRYQLRPSSTGSFEQPDFRTRPRQDTDGS